MSLRDVERWSPRVVVVRGLNPGPFTGPGTNTYLIGEGPRRLLLDTGSGKKGYVPLLERALEEECGERAFGDIVVTHVHGDHLGGAPALLERFGPRRVAKLSWPGEDERVDVPITPLEGEAPIETDGATLRAIHTPGHAPDHLCFYLEEERVLFTGDLILGAGTSVIPVHGGDLSAYLRSLEHLLELDVECIYPGHGPSIPNAERKIREYIQHRLEREEQILQAMQRGATTIPGMVERIYVDTPRALYPAAGQSVLCHLRKLEDERRATRVVDAGGEEHWTLV